MNIIQDKKLMEYFAKEYASVINEGHDSISAHMSIKEEIRNDHDGLIWDMVTSSDNVELWDFDDYLNAVMDEVEAAAEEFID